MCAVAAVAIPGRKFEKKIACRTGCRRSHGPPRCLSAASRARRSTAALAYCRTSTATTCRVCGPRMETWGAWAGRRLLAAARVEDSCGTRRRCGRDRASLRIACRRRSQLPMPSCLRARWVAPRHQSVTPQRLRCRLPCASSVFESTDALPFCRVEPPVCGPLHRCWA